MLKTKYIFLKKMYKDYAIVFLKNKKYYLLYDDIYLTNCFIRRGILFNLEYYHINYILLDGLEIRKIIDYDDNRYIEILYKGLLINLYKKNTR